MDMESRPLNRLAFSALLATAFVVAAALVVHGAVPEPTPAHLTNAASSVDELVGRFLDALQRRDRAALHALRVTKDEYIDLILRGNVPAGTPLRNWPAEVNEYWWSVLHTKSTYFEANILDGLGGHTYRPKSIAYRKGTQAYATYTAYKQLDLFVEDESGTEREIRTGSIAEVNGEFKFISFIRD